VITRDIAMARTIAARPPIVSVVDTDGAASTPEVLRALRNTVAWRNTRKRTTITVRKEAQNGNPSLCGAVH
jgi:hypothetical protein